MYITICLSISLSRDLWGRSLFLAVVNSVVMNMHMDALVQVLVFSSFGYVPRSRSVGYMW